MGLKGKVDVTKATHVRTKDGTIHKIDYKWGIDKKGRLSKPSEGGFGCYTEDGRRVSMWDAMEYYKEESE